MSPSANVAKIFISLLILGAILVDETNSQITFSRAWVPQGKRSITSIQHNEVHGRLKPTTTEARREARVATLLQVASDISVSYLVCI